MVKPVDVLKVRGFKFPQGYYLHHGHAWARIEEGSSVRIGMDDFALALLGPLDRVEAPLMGKIVKQGEPCIEVARGERRAGVLCPLSGVVTAVNPKLRDRGNLVNEDPYTEGWAMTLQPRDLRKEIRGLMLAPQSTQFLEGEVARLHGIVEEALPLAADGGYFGKDIFGAMPQLGWERLTRAFLRT